MIRHASLLACCCACLTGHAAVDLSSIPDSHRWVLHVDLQQALQGELGRWAEDALADPTAAARVQLLENLSGIDLREDLHSLTVSGIDNQDREAVAQIRGSFERDRLTTLLAASEGHRVTTYGEHQLHHWTDPKKQQPQHGTLIGDGLALVSGSESALKASLDTIGGKADSLADAGTFADLADLDAAIIVGGATALDGWKDLRPNAAMLRQVQSLRLVVDQVGTDLSLAATVTAKEEAKAQQLQQVLQGLLALYVLGEQQAVDPAMQQLIQSLQVARDGSVVTVTTQVPVSDLRRLAEAHQARQTGTAAP